MKYHLACLWIGAMLVLGACGTIAAPAATTVPPAVNTPSTGQVVPPAASPAAPQSQRGGKVVMAMWQSPTTLNGLLNSQTVISEVRQFFAEGMTRVLPDGTRIAILAKDVPTVQNGGVSADGKTITYKLKDGILWSDGTPFTCDDVKVYLQAVMTPNVGVTSTTGYREIDTVDCPDPLTAVIKYKNFYAPFLTLFNSLFPKSAGDPKNMANWAYNRKPVGTGPFKVDEWVADDHVTLSRNDKYREPGKPYLDQVIIRILPSSEVAIQLLSSGELDIMWNNTEADLPLLDKMQGVKVASALQAGGERLYLNLAENKDPSDLSKPHMILSDLRVRQAIAFGLNKQRIIDKLLFGKAKPGSGEANAGYFNCTNVGPYPYAAEKAKSLLIAAGWVPGADGVRVAKGALLAPDGTRLRLKYSTTSGNKLREDSQVLVVEDMKAIGIEFFIENAPSAVVIGGWTDNSPRKHGNFDIIMYSSNGGVDIHSQFDTIFGSVNSPSEKNQNGTNYARFNNAQVDDFLKKAAAEPDSAKRKDMYCQISQVVYDQAPAIYLYQRFGLNSYRERVNGNVAANAWENVGWDAANWWVKDGK